jgi:hypothetical protein
MSDRFGHIWLNSKAYRIDPGSWRSRDVSDSLPRASTPGGGVIFSELSLYQPLNQTDWRHGAHFYWHTDASGYAETIGNIDTRHAGVVQLFTKLSNNLTSLRARRGLALSHDSEYLFGWGSDGLIGYNRNTNTWLNWSFIQGAVNQVWTNGRYTFCLPDGGRILKTNNLGVTDLTVTASGANYVDVSQVVTDDQYNTYHIEVISGVGDDQVRIVSDTVAATKRLTVSTNWTVNPGVGAVVRVWAWSQTGVNANSTDYKWIIAHDGFVYAGKDGTNEVYYDSTDDLSQLHGVTADDPAAIIVGTKGRGVLRAISFNGDLYFARADGLFRMDKDRTAARRVLDYADQVHENNFASLAVYNGNLIFPIRNQLYQWNGVRVSNVTPPRMSDSFPFMAYNYFTHFIVVGNFLLMLARAYNTSSTFSSDLIAWDGVGWHKLTRCTNQGPTYYFQSAAMITGGGHGDTLFLDMQGATNAGVYSIRFNDNNELPYADYPTTGEHALITSRFDAGYRRVTKSTPSLLVEASNLSVNSYLKVYYRLNNDTTWLPWGGTDGLTNLVNTSGVTELKNPSDPAAAGPNTGLTIEYYFLQLKFQLITTVGTASPILEGFTVRLLMRPDTDYGYSFNVLANEENEQAMGLVDERDAKTIIDDLRGVRDSKKPVTFTDLWGTAHFCYLTSITGLAGEEIADDMGANPNIPHIVTLNLVEVND